MDGVSLGCVWFLNQHLMNTLCDQVGSQHTAKPFITSFHSISELLVSHEPLKSPFCSVWGHPGDLVQVMLVSLAFG